MATTVELLEIQIKGNVSGLTSAANNAKRALAGLDDKTVNVRADADTSDAEGKIATLQQQIGDLGGSAEIGADTAAADENITGVQEDIEGLGGDADVGADTADADEGITGVQDDIDILGGDADVGADTTEADREIAGVQSDVDALEGDAEIGADTTDADSAISDVQGSISELGGDADVGADASDADAVITEIQADISALSGDADIGANDNASDVISEIAEAVEGLPDGETEIDADDKASSVIGDVEEAVEELPDGETQINADDNASDVIGDVSDGLDEIPDSVSTEIEASDPSGSMDTILSKAKNLLRVLTAAGVVQVGKKVIEFGYEIAGKANTAGDVRSNLAGAIGAEYEGAIEQWAEGMNATKGLNATGLISMAGQFTQLLNSSGVEMGEAVTKAERLSELAVDFASYAGGTPAEMAESIADALTTGRLTQLAGMLGVTKDSLDGILNQFASGIEVDEKGVEHAVVQTQDIVAAIMELASQKGITGHFDENINGFDQTAQRLGDAWLTLQENAGAYLTPAASAITGALAEIVSGIADFVGELGKSDFAKDINGYFGGMELSEGDISALVSQVTGPLDAVNVGVATSRAKLESEVGLFNSAYQNLMKLVLFAQTGDWEHDTAAEDQMAELVNKVRDAAIKTAQEGKQNLLSQYLLFSGDNGESTAAGIAAIDEYYNAMIAEVQTKADELARAVYASMGNWTQENVAEIKKKAAALAEATYQSAYVKVGAKEQLALDTAVQNGELSAGSAEALMQKMREASADSWAEYEQAYQEALLAMYEVAEATGQSGEDLTAGMRAEFAARSAEMENRRAEMIMDALMPGISRNMEGLFREREFSDQYDATGYKEFTAEAADFLKNYESVYEMTVDALANGLESPELERFAQIYELLSGETGDWMHKNLIFGEESASDVYAGLVAMYNELLHGTPEGAEEEPTDLSGIEDTLGGMSSAMQVIAGKEFSVKIGAIQIAEAVGRGNDGRLRLGGLRK